MSIPLLLLLFFLFISSSDGVQLQIVNNCRHPIWPAILGTAGHQTPANGGFLLPTGEQAVIEPPMWWSGRIWARQGCTFDYTEKGQCLTGDCGGQLPCNGLGGQPPATLVEMTLGTSSNPMHFYDVSLVDGFNLPVSIIPVGSSSSSCGVAACETDVNVSCPNNLVVVSEGRVVGCKSACLVTRDDRDCCRGEYASSSTCKPTVYGYFFKKICPRAYSYAYDEATGLKTCIARKYVITFCPPI